MRRVIVLCVILAVSLSSKAVADDRHKSISAATHRRLQEIEALLAESKLPEAREKLDALLADMPPREVDCAYIHYTGAMLCLQKEDYHQAKAHLSSAYELNCFPEKTRLLVLRNLAGLCMQEEDYEGAVTYYRAYRSHAMAPNEEVHIGLGTAYFYLKDYAAAIEVLTAAIRQFDPRPPAYLMLFSAYHELEQYSRAAEIMETMIRLWPEEPQYWLQLAGIYIEQESLDKALEILQSAWTRGYLAKESDLLQFVYLLYEKNLPFKAATVLEQAVSSKAIDENLKHYELLATFFREAKERPRAIEALKKATAFSADGRIDLFIAQLYHELENGYAEVVEYGERAIRKGVEHKGRAHMLVAVSCSELGRVEEAKRHLQAASRYKETQKDSMAWLKFLSAKDAPEKK
jgi:tetratricopeptide (TPR) repeat protein